MSAAASHRSLDVFELGALAAFAALSLWLVALNLYYATAHSLIWTGIDGTFPGDQMQYLAWIRDASRHVLVSDMFVSHPTPHDYLQPAIAISGGLVAFGMAPWLALLLWKPVAVGATFLAVRSLCHDTLSGAWQRRAALVLALFAGSLAAYGNEWLPFMTWGYPFDLLAVAALAGALHAYGRARARRASPAWALSLGVIAAWLHPWQGELLIVVIAVTEVVNLLLVGQGGERPGRRERLRSAALAAATVGATAVPLAYYAVLRHYDVGWRTAAAASQYPWPLPRILLSLAPLLIAAAPAYAKRPRTFQAAAIRVWPLAALIVWAVNQAGVGGWSLYAWVGITIPLGILAVEGVSTLGFGRLRGRRWIAGAALTLLTVPVAVYYTNETRYQIGPAHHGQNLARPSLRAALSYLAADPVQGAVLSTFPIDDTIPGETGRTTLGGDGRWTPNYAFDERTAWNVLHGWLPRARAESFVRGTGARFILANCSSKTNLEVRLAPLVVSVRRFGCLTLYELRAAAPTRRLTADDDDA